MHLNNQSAQNTDSTGKIKLILTIFFVGFILIGGTVFFTYHKVEDEAIKSMYFVIMSLFIAVSATAMVIGASAFYLIQSLHQGILTNEAGIRHTIELTEKKNKELSLNRALSYISRWNSIKHMPANKVAFEVYELVHQGKSSSEQEELLDAYLRKNTRRKQNIVYVLNFLEELAIAIETNSINYELSRTFFRGIVIEYCATFEIFIAKRRKLRNNRHLYQKLTSLATTWKEENGNGNGNGNGSE